MSARISADGLYRYDLRRQMLPNDVYCDDDRLAFIMCNPSTADAELDDPTIRRCKAFAAREGVSLLTVVNLWSYRATDPDDLIAAHRNGIDITGGDEGREWLLWAIGTSRVVVAWGAVAAKVPGFTERVAMVVDGARQLDGELLCLGTTKDGHPRHPLYVKGDAPLTRWQP